MLKLAIADVESNDEVLEFSLIQNSGGDLVLEQDGWAVLGLRVVNGKVNFVRYCTLEDENYNTNDEGQIEEVPE